MSKTSPPPAFADGGPPPVIGIDRLWEWLVSDFHLQTPAIISLHQSASRLASLAKSPVARNQVGEENDEADEHLCWTYGQLRAAGLRVASFLSSQIARKQDNLDEQTVIVTFVYNSVEWAVFFFAAIALGLPFCPLDPGYLEQPDEFNYYMECLDPSIIIVENTKAAEEVDGYAPKAYAKILCQSDNDRGVPDGWWDLDHLPIEDVPNSDPRNLRGAKKMNRSMTKDFKDESDLQKLPDDTAIVLFSSGTSGRPKGCPHTANSFALQVEGYLKMKTCKWGRSVRNITVSSAFRPICWLSSLATWRSGGVVVFPAAQFDAAATIRAIESQRGTHIKLVPPQATGLIAENEKGGSGTLEFVSMGGNIIGDKLLNEFKESFSADRVLSIWGMSEGAGVIGWDRDDEEIPSTAHGLSAHGRVLPGTKVRIVDPQSEDRKLVGKGEIGDFHISSPMNIRRYLFNRNADEFYTDEQGSWFVTGDHAKMDHSGIIYVLGRAKDSITTNGTILIPGNMEACLDKFPGIESQVVAVPDSERGEVPVGIIKSWPKDGEQVTKSQLEDAIKQDFGSEAALDDVLTLGDLQMEDWPYNTTAKILKKDLTDAVSRLRDKS